MIILSIFFTLSLLSIIALIFLLNKSLTREKKCMVWLNTTSEDIHNTIEKLRVIDDRQIFEKDDEVGFIFSELTKTLEELNEKIEIQNKQ